MKYMIAISPDGVVEKREVPVDSVVPQEMLREMVGDDFAVVPTGRGEMALILYGDSTEENPLAASLLRPAHRGTVLGYALVAHFVFGRVRGFSAAQADFCMMQLERERRERQNADRWGLKPCPFCGGEATRGSAGYHNAPAVRCAICNITVCAQTDEQATELWNRMVDKP